MLNILNFSKSKIVSFLIFIFLFQRFDINAQNFYWENPEKLTSKDCRFPQAVSNFNSSAFFWQEVDTQSSLIYLSGKIKISNNEGKDFEDIEKVRVLKKEKRGGFSKRIYLEDVR